MQRRSPMGGHVTSVAVDMDMDVGAGGWRPRRAQVPPAHAGRRQDIVVLPCARALVVHVKGLCTPHHLCLCMHCPLPRHTCMDVVHRRCWDACQGGGEMQRPATDQSRPCTAVHAQGAVPVRLAPRPPTCVSAAPGMVSGGGRKPPASSVHKQTTRRGACQTLAIARPWAKVLPLVGGR